MAGCLVHPFKIWKSKAETSKIFSLNLVRKVSQDK